MSETSAIRVNFSDKEASSEARDFDPMPTGKYPVYITDIDLRESTSEKNFGKQYWSIEFTVDNPGSPYDGRKLWTNCMLFDGALYTLAQLLKAVNREDAIQSGDVPPADFFIGKKVLVNAKKELNKYSMDKEREQGVENPEPQYRTEVKSIKAFEEGASTTTAAPAKGKQGKKDSLLP